MYYCTENLTVCQEFTEIFCFFVQGIATYMSNYTTNNMCNIRNIILNENPIINLFPYKNNGYKNKT